MSGGAWCPPEQVRIMRTARRDPSRCHPTPISHLRQPALITNSSSTTKLDVKEGKMRTSEPHQMCVVSRETLKQALVALRVLKINSVNRAAYVRAKIEGAYE